MRHCYFSLFSLTLFTPLLQTTSVTKEMSDYNLWCYIQGDNTAFPLIASSTIFVDLLKDSIKEERKNGVLKNVDAKDLTLWKVRMTFLAIRSDIMGDTTLSYAGYPCQAI